MGAKKLLLPFCDCLQINLINGRKAPRFESDFHGAMFVTTEEKDICVHCGHYVMWTRPVTAPPVKQESLWE